jgi:uncharacterized protein (TIGR03083 family)
MDIREFVDALDEQGRLLAGTADLLDLDLQVPTCPEWKLRDLLNHIGDVHRWAATFVSEARTDMLSDEENKALFDDDRPADADLVDWFRLGHAALVEAVRSAPRDLECWTFFPADSPLAFWARRQTHETTIHRVDVESISASLTPLDARLSADGISELLFGFASRGRKLVQDPERWMVVETTDTGDRWLLIIGTEKVSCEDVGGKPLSGPSDCVVRGSAQDLYLALWNRLPVGAIHSEGDPSVFARFRESLHIRWG